MSTPDRSFVSPHESPVRLTDPTVTATPGQKQGTRPPNLNLELQEKQKSTTTRSQSLGNLDMENGEHKKMKSMFMHVVKVVQSLNEKNPDEDEKIGRAWSREREKVSVASRS